MAAKDATHDDDDDDDVGLIDDDGELTPALERALKTVFERYDADKDGALCESELDALAVRLNGVPFSADDKTDLRDNFDVTKDGHLTLNGFLQMYHLQTTSDPSETWRDLRKFGYERRDGVLERAAKAP